MRHRIFTLSFLLLIAVVGLALSEEREVVILYTNDFHSAIEPIPAYWLPGEPKPNLGGAAHLMTLVERIRRDEARRGVPVFLFDTGDMFTGMLAKLTKGEALIEMMITLRYDALGIGNHEFDYGWENFRRQMFRAPFPVLGANIFYKDSEIPFAPPHAILERDGIRLGVIGIIGQDAKSVVLPSLVEELRFEDPAPAIARSIEELENEVDLVVVLAHQGHTGPMQTDAEHHPEIQRDFDADVALAGEVPGIDVFVGGHAHRGIEVPFVHRQTGSLIVQTYGYGTRLGYLRVKVDTETGKVVSHEGELLKVWSDELPPDPAMAEKMAEYRRQVAPVIGEVVGRTSVRLVRSYNTESLLGAFSADVIRGLTQSEIAFMNAGGLRADLPEGDVDIGNVQDAFPFFNTVDVLELTGVQVREILEQGFTLLRGMIQVSGIEASYDLSKPFGKRLVEARVGGEPLVDGRAYRVATNSFLGEGGDLYQTFLLGKKVGEIDKDVAQVVIEYFRSHEGTVPSPAMGRLVSVGPASKRAGPIAVQGAVDSELGPLLEAIGSPKPRVIDNFSFWEGEIGGVPVVVSRTEVGMVHGAVATSLLIREFAPSAIINQGTAGAVATDLEVGDIVIGRASAAFDAVRTPPRKAGEGIAVDDWTILPRLLREGGDRVRYERFDSDPRLVEVAAGTPYEGGRLVEGIVGSADQWNREVDKLLWAEKTFGIASEDMESAAAHQVAQIYRVPFVALRIVSNSEHHDPEFRPEVGAACARYVIDVVKRLGSAAW
jgi:2',3'-cyclic-nucleotide 2'-phosphodiesterase (5'-nucleotidase family)/nucleoside phosphorylase